MHARARAQDARMWVVNTLYADHAEGDDGDAKKDQAATIGGNYSRFPRLQFYKAFGGAKGMVNELREQIIREREKHKQRIARREKGDTASPIDVESRSIDDASASTVAEDIDEDFSLQI